MDEALGGWRRRATATGALADCGLVVATFRRPREAVAQLDALAALPDAPGEVVVVDGSPDGETGAAIAAWARATRHPFDLAYVRSAPGLTRQRNVGIDASSRELLFFLDDDCIPLPGYFAEIRRVFRAPGAERVGAVCGTIVNEMNGELTLRWRLRFLLRLVPRDGVPGRYYPTATSVPKNTMPLFSGTRPIDIVPGGAAAYRREALGRQRFSLFFDGYAQGEDLEMSLRLRREWTLLWCGDAHVLHNHAPGGRPPRFVHGRMAVRNRYFIWKRHSPDARWTDRVRFWADVGFGIGYDLASYLVRPFWLWRLGYVLGALRGVVDCLVDPPRYEEPARPRPHQFRLEELVDA